jgi:hypothetical protein
MIRVVLAVAMALGTAEASMPLREECPLNSAAHARDVSALAFEGTVTKLDVLENYERMATLDVVRVWKGKPTKRTEVFFILGSSTSPRIELGKRYLIFARPRTSEERQQAGLPHYAPHREAWVPDCIGVLQPSEAAYKELGPSRPPD